MQEGSLRADINLSVREIGSDILGTRTEMKNMNSFKAIVKAIEAEKKRQIEWIESGKKVIQETRRWDDNKNTSFAMRSKEDAKDYRYFPEPDLPPLELSKEWLEQIKKRQPELRDQKMQRYQTEYGLPEYDAAILTGSKPLAELFEKTTALCKKPKEVSNWLMVETLRMMKERELEPDQLSLQPEKLAELIRMVEDGKINRTISKEVFEHIFLEDIDPKEYVKENGLEIIRDDTLLRKTVEKVIEENPQSVKDYQNGKEKIVGYLVGQTMKVMKGKADPTIVNQMIKDILRNIVIKSI